MHPWETKEGPIGCELWNPILRPQRSMPLNHAIPSRWKFVRLIPHLVPIRSLPPRGLVGVRDGFGVHTHGPPPAPRGVPRQVGVTRLALIDTSRPVMKLLVSAGPERPQSPVIALACFPWGQPA